MSDPAPTDRVLRPADLARTLGTTKRSVQRLLRAGALPGVLVAGRWYTRESELLVALSSKTSAAPGATS